MCLLEFCAGDDKADEDVDGSWCLDLKDDVHNLGEFILLVVFVRIGDGSGEGNMIFFFIFGGDGVSGDKGDFLVIFSETLMINVSQNHHYLFFS